jgi:nucleoside-diphosphate-sugar epimerase
MKTILITGINGFLGSHLAKALSAEYNIIGLEYSLENLFRISECNYKVYSAKDSIPDEIFIEQSIDIIIHTATFYGKNNEDFNQMFNANLYSPFNLLDKAILHGCQLFVNTDTVLDRFVSTYALTKKQFQEWLYLRRNEIKGINMQLEHFYGPGAGSANFITAMINKLKNNEPQIDLTLGEQQRDFVYIDDVVNAYQTVLEKQNLITDSYTSYQVCTNQLISIKDLMLILKDLTQSSSVLNFGAVAYRENELMHSETNNAALLKLGWQPQFTIKEGLQKSI